jgi:rhamnosyltransferase
VLRASVIIETKDAARSLGATLERVFDQQVAPLEVIVVDVGSRARAAADTGATSDALFVSIARDEWSNARALNRAARAARGEVLVLLSARCRPVGTDWLENLLRHFDDPTVAGVWGGSQFGANRALPPFGPPTRQLRGTYTRENWMWGLSNANGAVRASLLAQEPFDESFPALEDKHWARVMMERGYCIVHDPAAAVWHDRDPMRFARRRRRLVTQGFAQMFPEGGSELPLPAIS